MKRSETVSSCKNYPHGLSEVLGECYELLQLPHALENKHPFRRFRAVTI